MLRPHRRPGTQLALVLAGSALVVGGLPAAATVGHHDARTDDAPDSAVATPETGQDPLAAPVTVRLRKAIRQLPVERERRRGYDRDKYDHWTDADGDCEDTRAEVLKLEATGPVEVSDCIVRTGTWSSYYDEVTVEKASSLDIDHLVPLAEAHDSGARRWKAGTRRRFANDLGDPRALVAVTASSNRSKSDRDPAEWMPEFGQCRYLREWVAVKSRWALSVNRAEKKALRGVAKHCANVRITYSKAKVRERARTDPRFDTCAEAKANGYGPYVQGVDEEYAWYRDGDGDGIACE